MKTENKIINLLKTNGPMTAQTLAKELKITSMGIRQHLLKLQDRCEIVYEDRKAARGRPTRYWILTEKCNTHFPDGHETLNLQLIDSVKSVFGEKGLNQLIEQREKESHTCYANILNRHNSLEAKLHALAQIRTDEGYMAEVKHKDGAYWLLENHCSICAAAKSCLNFCRSELQLFQSLFKDSAQITREEHIMQGARRCAYKVIPNSSI